LEQITAGTRGLNPVPAPTVPAWLSAALAPLGISLDFTRDYWLYYYLTLGLLLLVIVLLRNLERSRLGRAWMAVREDELAATCMGINAARVKMSALALVAGLAGMAGCLYATALTSTAGPDAYDFARSIIMLCCIILGGLGSIRGTLLGVLLLIGFDNVVAPVLDNLIQSVHIDPNGTMLPWLAKLRNFELWQRLTTFSNWRLMIFGLALVLAMRFRPEGLLPSSRVEAELHPERNSGANPNHAPA
jgi:branched-chain amino acid transport system permease protein